MVTDPVILVHLFYLPFFLQCIEHHVRTTNVGCHTHLANDRLHLDHGVSPRD